MERVWTGRKPYASAQPRASARRWSAKEAAGFPRGGAHRGALLDERRDGGESVHRSQDRGGGNRQAHRAVDGDVDERPRVVAPVVAAAPTLAAAASVADCGPAE